MGKRDTALQEMEWKFQALFEKGPIGVAYHEMIYDDSGKPIDYRFIDANDTYKNLTGVDPRGKTVLEAFPGIEKDTFDWIGIFGHVARTGEQKRFESYLQANGQWYDVVGYQYKPDHFVAAFTNITERKQAEEIDAFLSQAGSKTSDEPIFDALTRFPAQTLQMDYVCIDRLDGDQLNTTTLAV